MKKILKRIAAAILTVGFEFTISALEEIQRKMASSDSFEMILFSQDIKEAIQTIRTTIKVLEIMAE